jgi:hypothetical protein
MKPLNVSRGFSANTPRSLQIRGTAAPQCMLAAPFVWKVAERVEPENGNRRSD